MNIEEIKISKWRDLDKIRALKGGWIFRGQANAAWPISSSLEREHLTCDRSKLIAINQELFMLREFIRKAHKISDIKLGTSQIIEWLTVMQHYGCPTRLVDFTRSFYVASYFALHSKNCNNSDAAIWAFNEKWLFKRSVSFFEEINETSRKLKLRNDFQDFILSNSNDLLHKSHSSLNSDEKFQIKPTLIVVEPFLQFERYALQKSVFIMPTNINVSFEENLFGLLENSFNTDENSIKKYIIKNDFFSDLAKDLKQMNITAEVLFPGLEGVAKSISESWTYYNPL
ncbi:MAG: FRG domain-containing protein [Balneolia bacterium]|nr:FRG domain-containing protein [Balneolia bacterium]